MVNLPIHLGYQWSHCHGSARMQALYPPDPNVRNEKVEEGKACEWLSEQMFESLRGGTETPTKDVIGTLSPNEVVIDQQMYEAALEFVNDIFRYCNQHQGLKEFVQFQYEVDMSWYMKDQKGRINAWVYNQKQREIVIWELKYGHRIVEPFENVQLIGYAKSIVDKLQFDGIDDQNHKVILKVVQPRGYHVDGIIREWELKASDIRPYVNQIVDNAHHAASPDAKCRPKAGICDTCDARHSCESLQQAVHSFFDYLSEPMPAHLDAHALSVETKILRAGEKLLKARLSGVESQCLAELKRGVDIPGFASQQGYGREKWRSDVELDEVVQMAELLGVDCLKPREIDTPAQLRKKGIDETVIKEYSFIPKTSVKLVEDNGSKARQIFK